MIYLYGQSKALNIRTIDIHDITCKSCEQKETLQLHSFVSYIHLFFIPLITEGKKSIISCENCEKEYNISKQSAKVQLIAKSEQDYIKIPIWHFSGLIILVSTIIFSLTYSAIVDN